MPKPKFILSTSQSSKFSENNKINITKIYKWSNFEQEMETFIKNEINKKEMYQKPNNILKYTQLENHDSYKIQIFSICFTIFSECLLRNIEFVTEKRQDTSSTFIQSDICCLENTNKEILAIIEVKTINNLTFENDKQQVLTSEELIEKFETNSNYNNCIHQLYSYMILNNTKYGLLSIYKYTIFFQISFDNNKEFVLQISNPIKIDSFLNATFYILSISPEKNKIIEDRDEYLKVLDQTKQDKTKANTRNSERLNSLSIINSDNFNESNFVNNKKFKSGKKSSTNMDYDHGGDSSDSAYSSTTTSSTNLRLNIENELTHAFFHAKDIIGSGRTGDVLKLKIDSNNKFLAFKFVDIYTRKRDIKKELKNEIHIYKWLQNKNIECIPKLVFDGVVLIFLSLVTEIVDGKIIEFNKMNQDQKNSCIESLKTLHINGVLHKDLRPSNFIIKENNQCIIIDFGFSEKYEQINEKEQELFEIEMDELKELLYASN